MYFKQIFQILYSLPNSEQGSGINYVNKKKKGKALLFYNSNS